MARRDDGKAEALAASRTLNPRPEKVTDPAFRPGGFFDPADLVQVKYEMVRKVEVDGAPPGRTAAEFGLSRQSLYSARTALADHGLAGLLPGKPGPKGGHKLTDEVVDHLRQLLRADPRLRPEQLADAVERHFGVRVHPRSVQRALSRRHAAEQAREDASKSR
jgi:transposase